MRSPRFGVEYTFVCKDNDSSISDAIQDLKARSLGRPHHDDGCLEVPSPIHRTIGSARRFYEKIVPIVERYGLKARVIKRNRAGSLVYHGTGGGHVHVELPRDEKARARTMYRLIRLVNNMPWLGWVFNEFMDDWNAKALLGNNDVRALMKGELKLDLVIRATAISDNDSAAYLISDQLAGILGDKEYALNFCHQDSGNMTAEFRFFDAPRSWKQAEEHIKIALGLVKLAEVGWNGFCDLDHKNHFLRFHERAEVESKFMALVTAMDLNWADYKKYMRNFDDRKRYGRLV